MLQAAAATPNFEPVPVIIRSMNADVSPTTRLHELEGTAINMLSHASPRMLLIDEIHNLLSCSAETSVPH